MEALDTLVCARWVAPVEPDGTVLENHAVAIRAGRIVAVLPIAEARARFAPGECLERPHHLLLPGLVDAHLRTTAALGRCHPADPDCVRDGAELAIAALLRAGVTCFADVAPWPDVLARTAAELHVRASVGLVVADGASGWASGADEHFAKGLALRDEYRGDPLLTTHFVPTAVDGLDDATLTRVRRLADELEVPVVVPLHESRAAVERSLERHGARPLQRLARLGLASPVLIAVHLTQAEAAELDLVAEAGIGIVHCPTSDLRYGAGACPAASLLARGVRVGLGTHGSGDDDEARDVRAQMQAAVWIASGNAGAPGRLVPRDALRMATLEGARVLGLGDCTGSLVPGKWADMCCVDLHQPRSWPVHDVLETFVHSCSSDQVTDTWVAGRRVYADGVLQYLDEAAVLERADAWRSRIDLPGDGRSEA